jgi:hypothetical protein
VEAARTESGPAAPPGGLGRESERGDRRERGRGQHHSLRRRDHRVTPSGNDRGFNSRECFMFRHAVASVLATMLGLN